MGTVRVLLLRPDHLGDVLVTLPALRCVPSGAMVTYAAPPGVADICSRCPYVDCVAQVVFPPLDRPVAVGR